MSTGELVSAYRKREGLTIDELVEKSGVPKGTLNKITNGVTKSPSIETVKAIARALNCTLEDFYESEKLSIESEEEIELIKRYRAIGDHGKKLVFTVLEMEYEKELTEKGQETLSISYNTKEA